MRSDLAALLPKDKMDTERAKAIIALNHAEVEPLLPALLEWMQDINWPVAQVLQPFLARVGRPLAPHVRNVLETDDDVWKGWVLRHIVAESPELQAMLGGDIERLANHPTPGERAEELDILAKELLA
ncbi:DUF5071 domain-containing protein [Bradyrhizobium erythrophlei]|uniref:DUF5071 domain-containing protein n=1 Tax=Bradyrhizobium erythrophlei TaxID=1437360 RepID=A0A1H4LQW4_9BRAD|nr:DUF5071 domain-containing protein [Bradyrhizobium erythrophlei]SEB73073.1 protein of unknown function [Bradyrhizobium erythrophlei]